MINLKPIALTISILMLSFFINSCKNNTSDKEKTMTEAVTKDTLLAKKLNADDYGMKQYVMAFLKAGPERSQSKTEAAELQRAHLDNITRLAEEGKLILAGPFLDGGELRGIYIFNVESIEAAMELTASDPAIKAGRLIMELHPWYGSAALQELPAIHKRIALKDI